MDADLNFQFPVFNPSSLGTKLQHIEKNPTTGNMIQDVKVDIG